MEHGDPERGACLPGLLGFTQTTCLSGHTVYRPGHLSSSGYTFFFSYVPSLTGDLDALMGLLCVLGLPQ